MGEKRLPVTEETRERVKALKRGDETYDDVINRLLGDEEAGFNATATITPTLDETAVDAIREQLEAVAAEAVENGANTDAILQAIGTVEERTGRIERQLEDLQR